MSYMKPYWIGSNVPYEEYLRRRDIAREGAKPVVAAISEQTKAIVGELQTVNRNLEQIDRTLRWGFAETIQQLRFMNETLSELLKAVKNPAQTAAFEQFEIARDAYRRGLYPEALAAITAAIDGNNASPGYKLEWRFHFFLGFLRLGNFDNTSPEVVDLAKAEAAFLEAARIARVDNPDEAARALTAAGWAALVASGGSGEALERAHTHTLNARRTWEGIVDEGNVATGRADTYAQLAKVAAVRGDDAQLCEAFETAIVLDYGKLAAAVEDGDLAARTATDAAVSAAIGRQLSWLKAETQRRLEIAVRVGIDQGVAGEAFAFAQRLTHTPTAAEALTYVASGLTAAPTQSYNSFWDQLMLSRVCVHYMTNVNSVTSTGTGFVFQTFKWANVEEIATSGSAVLRTASPWVQVHVRLHAPPIIGTRARVEYQEIVLGGGGYRRGEFEVELLGRSLNIRSNAHHADLWHAGQRYELRSDNANSKRFLKLTNVHPRVMSTIYIEQHEAEPAELSGPDAQQDTLPPVGTTLVFARLKPEHDEVVETVEYIQPGKQERQSAQIRAITYAPIEWTHPGVGIIKNPPGADNSSSDVQKSESGLIAMLDRMQQKADAMQKDADAALAKARQEAADNPGGKPLDTTDKLLLVAVLVLLAVATIVGALK